MKVLSKRLAAAMMAAAAFVATSSATSAAPSEAYFGRPEIVARTLERHYSNRGPTASSALAYGQLQCAGSRYEIRCTSPGRVEGFVPIARVEWKLELLSDIHASLSQLWYAVEGTGDRYLPGEEISSVGGIGTRLALQYGLSDWETAAPLHPTDGPWPDGARFGTYADGAWLPNWAKRFRQPAQVARAFRAAIDSYPVASGRLPPGFTRVGRHPIKQGRARCQVAPKLIRCSATGRMLRTEQGEGPSVPVTVRWRLTKYSSRSAQVEIGVYSTIDAPYDRAGFSGPWKKGEWIGMPNSLLLGGAYPNGSTIPPSALGLKQW